MKSQGWKSKVGEGLGRMTSRFKLRRMPQPLNMQRSDREFLPAALEILEQPASPVGMALIWFVCLVAVAALLWSWLGHVDIHAIAQGKVQPDGRSKVVQSLEAGRVAAIHVDNGSRVEAQQLVLELDAAETGADSAMSFSEVVNARAEIARRDHALALMHDPTAALSVPGFPSETGLAVRQREQESLAADVLRFRATQMSLQSQMQERQAQAARLRSGIELRARSLEALERKVKMHEAMLAAEAGPQIAVLEARQELQRELGAQASEQGQLVEVSASMASLQARMKEAASEFRESQTTRRLEAQRRLERAEQEWIKASARQGRTRLRAPVAGVVQQLAVSTVGQVVSSAQPLLVVVPSDQRLEVEALVLNRDIGFVHEGQEAMVKVDAFPFTRYGTIRGRVVRISRDAIDEREAAAMTDPASSSRMSSLTAQSATPKVQNLVFPVSIELEKSALEVDGQRIALSAGMTVSAEIKTGRRRVIDYLLSPIREVGSQAIRER